MQHSLLYDWKHHLKPFGLGGAVKPEEEEDQRLIESITTLFVERPLALPGSAKHKRFRNNINRRGTRRNLLNGSNISSSGGVSRRPAATSATLCIPRYNRLGGKSRD